MPLSPFWMPLNVEPVMIFFFIIASSRGDFPNGS